MSAGSKIYISLKFEEIEERYQHIKEKLEEAGYEVVSNWDKHQKCSLEDNTFDPIAKQQATEDLKGIEECDIFLIEYFGRKGTGMFLELGYALGLNKRIIAVGPEVLTSSMFMHLPIIEKYDGINHFLKKKR